MRLTQMHELRKKPSRRSHPWFQNLLTCSFSTQEKKRIWHFLIGSGPFHMLWIDYSWDGCWTTTSDGVFHKLRCLVFGVVSFVGLWFSFTAVSQQWTQNLKVKISYLIVWDGKMMFQRDDHSTYDSLIHVWSDWPMYKLLLSNDGHLAKPSVLHICFTVPAADMLTYLTSHPKICTTRPWAVTQSGHSACNTSRELCYRGGNKEI